MAAPDKPLQLSALGDGGKHFIWGLWLGFSSETDRSHLNNAFENFLSVCGRCSVDEVLVLADTLTSAARRLLDMAPESFDQVTTDEASILGLLAATQADDKSCQTAHLD